MGPTPHHIAFIMDGNRRYAKKLNVERIAGHRRGYSTLLEVLKWCNHLNVKIVTVYAFALDNFKRSKHEVDSLMELAAQKVTEMLDARREITQYGVRVNILGNLDRLPPKLQQAMARVMQSTRGHNRLTLNIAFAYSAKQELADATAKVAKGLESGTLREDDINTELLERCLYTAEQPHPDLLIRTSGETRLSDFLVNQCRRGTCLSFIQPLWPELSFWQFWAVIFSYQRQYRFINDERNRLKILEGPNKSISSRPSPHSGPTQDDRVKAFMRKVELEHEHIVDKFAINNSGGPVHTKSW